jgi:uncharacterized CHY-type Zn-finger protein
VAYNCPKCHGVLERVDFQETPRATTARPRTVGQHFSVTCPLCQTAIHVSAEQIGQSLDCPNCLTSVEVKPPDGTALSRAVDESEPDRVAGAGAAVDAPASLPTGAAVRSVRQAHREANPGEPSSRREAQVVEKERATAGTLVSMPPPPDDRYFAVVCPLCHTRLEATREQVGQSITCPDCRRPFEIKAPPPAIAKYRWTEDDGVELQIEPTFERPQIEKPVLPAIDDKRKPRRSAAARRAKPLPLERLVSGVADFLRYSNVWPRWLGYSIVLLIPLELLHFGFNQPLNPNGTRSAGAVLALLAALVQLSVWFISICGILLTVIDDTSDGLDRVENWPERYLFNGVRPAAMIFFGLVLSVLPGGVICGAIGLEGDLSWVPIAISVLILFPFVLLSMLETDSALTPFSQNIWEGLHIAGEAWTATYGFSLAIWGLFAAIDWASKEFISVPEISSAIGALSFVAALFVYYRLLGRLAWILAVRLDDVDEEGTTNDTKA